MKLVIFALVILFTIRPSYSQENVSVLEHSQESQESQNFAKRWWDNSKNRISKIYNEGQNDFYLTLYAYHDRFTYTPEKLKELNEGAFGLGVGKSKMNEHGNTEMLFFMAHLDSHSDMQVDGGYAWTKNFHFSDEFRLGVGFATGLVSRSDMANRIPIPFILPLATMEIGRISMNAILIPKLNDGINNGNVVFIFGKYSWDGKN